MAEIIPCDYVIIGGGIAGTTAAETIREQDAYGSIVLISSEPYPLYSRVLLPRYVRGNIAEEKVILRQLGDYEERRISLYLSETVQSLDMEKREAYTNADRTFLFKKLLIASGGHAAPWEHARAESERVLRFQTLDDARRIISATAVAKEKTAAVIGGGFIALEFLELFVHKGFTTTLFARGAYFWEHVLDENGGRLLEELFEIKGISVRHGAEISDIAAQPFGLVVQTKDGRRTEAALVGVGIGLERNLFFVPAQIARGTGVLVDEELRTNIADVWAAGDVAEYRDGSTGRRRVTGNWTQSFVQGRIAGSNMAGAHEKFHAVAAYSVKVFDTVITQVGDVEREADGKNEVVSRTDIERRRHEMFVLRDGRIIGAILVNAFAEKSTLAELIERRTNVSSHKSSLASLDFVLASLL